VTPPSDVVQVPSGVTTVPCIASVKLIDVTGTAGGNGMLSFLPCFSAVFKTVQGLVVMQPLDDIKILCKMASVECFP
jgi:hypothetical protein